MHGDDDTTDTPKDYGSAPEYQNKMSAAESYQPAPTVEATRPVSADAQAGARRPRRQRVSGTRGPARVGHRSS